MPPGYRIKSATLGSLPIKGEGEEGEEGREDTDGSSALNKKEKESKREDHPRLGLSGKVKLQAFRRSGVDDDEGDEDGEGDEEGEGEGDGEGESEELRQKA